MDRPAPRRRRAAMAVAVAAGALLCALLLSGCLRAVSAEAPDWALPTVLYDRSGGELFRFHAGEDRQPVPLRQVPRHVRAAFIAIEDPRFYDHTGLDLRGIARAAVNNILRALGLRQTGLQGASTITQQLARNAWLGHEQTWARKLSEAVLALRLETAYSKDEILELYLNQIYFGHGAYGIERAARLYFGKPASALTVAEGALLAGLINGPSLYDPHADPEAARERRNLVLDAMVRTGALTPEEGARARAEKLAVAPLPAGAAGNAFVDRVIDLLTTPELAARLGITPLDSAALARAGLKVYTTLDPGLQAIAEAAVRDGMARADAEYGLSADPVKPEAAAVVLEPSSGHVLAMVGGRRRTGLREYNRAVDARRQPGSTFKPFAAYLPAMEAAGLGPATVLDDAPAALTEDGRSVWPENYDFRYQGLVPVRHAVEQSLNPVAVRALRLAGGPASGLAYARRFGFAGLTDQDARPALALGGLTHGVTPLELAAAYGTLANLGARVDPVLILRIEDARGQVIYRAPAPRPEQVVSPGAAYLMVDMLKGVIRRGTAAAFTGGFRGWPAAGKTGTTDGNADAWFAGFTRNLVTVVWNGYDAPRPLKWTGAFVPVQIWHAIMARAVTDRPPDWTPPPEVVSAAVCRRTGRLPDSLCPPGQVVTELFLRRHLPQDAGNLLVRAPAVPAPGGGWLLWQPGCTGAPQWRVFLRRPEPYVRHPTAPRDPRYVPADAAEELPAQSCTPAARGGEAGGIGDWLTQWFRGGRGKGKGSPGR